MKNFLLSLVTILFLSSCVHKSGRSTAQKIFINKGSINSKIDLIILEGGNLEYENYYELNFNAVKEGGTYIFGQMVNGVKADQVSRVKILKNGETIANYSISEIKKMNTKFISDSIKVFIIPEFN